MNLLVEGIKNGTVIKTELTTKLTLDGLTDVYPIYKIRLDNLYFNDRNDRIATWISKYKAENNLDDIDHTNLREYNEIIKSFIEASNPERLKNTQNNIEFIGQQKSGIVLNDGRIIDGNRRYTCLTNLAKKDPKFNYFEAVILDKDIEYNAKQIKMLELQVQIGEDTKVDYDPIDRLVGVYRDVVENKLLTIHEYAMSTNQSEKDVQKLIDIATLLVEFLETINAPNKFYIARELDLNGPLYELHGILKKIKDEEQKEAVKYAVFTNFLMQPNKDMTRFVRQIKSIATSKYLDEFIEKESEIAEEVLDSIPSPENVTEESISKVRENKAIKEKLEDTMEIVTNKVKVTDTKNKPNQILTKIYDSLEEIDTNIFVKLSDDQKEEIMDKLDLIDAKVEEIRGSIDV